VPSSMFIDTSGIPLKLRSTVSNNALFLFHSLTPTAACALRIVPIPVELTHFQGPSRTALECRLLREGSTHHVSLFINDGGTSILTLNVVPPKDVHWYYGGPDTTVGV
jgi:hypothetical protein